MLSNVVTYASDEMEGFLERRDSNPEDHPQTFLQFALFNFKRSLNVYEKLKNKQETTRSTVKLVETIRERCRGRRSNQWTWKELVDLVKYSEVPIEESLLSLPSAEHNKMALECFKCIMRYMGDFPLKTNQTEIDCLYTILSISYRWSDLRDEVYCQLIKQTTNNKSPNKDSCLKGWRMMMLLTAFFPVSDILKPYFMHHLETVSNDERRNFCENARICLKNLHKTLKCGGRKNVPSLEELIALSNDKIIKQQVYYIAGGTKLIVDTWTTSTVHDIIREICYFLNVRRDLEMEEFGLYCIVEGDPYTLPLQSDEYVLDVMTELTKNNYVFYLLFSRIVWYHPVRLDNHLYIEIIYNQMAPDYMDGLFLLSSGPQLGEQTEEEIARIGALLHCASNFSETPKNQDILYLLPRTLPYLSILSFEQWVSKVCQCWEEVKILTSLEAKAQCLDILQKWPLFGSSFFTVMLMKENLEVIDHVLAINKNGVLLLDIDSHECIWESNFTNLKNQNKKKEKILTLINEEKQSIEIKSEYVMEILSLIQQYIDVQRSSSIVTTMCNFSINS
ncbi:unconventional myosin-XV-like [Centruroides sculpturatus]|uniref:unconventional myosin-XV-like n=1 Tax=Centruroides sculpturatus TaxID=218467 RepID=UPI000C6D423B|nr:unconventional myosin-XV-like [Centruroides sculpturatus]